MITGSHLRCTGSDFWLSARTVITTLTEPGALGFQSQVLSCEKSKFGSAADFTLTASSEMAVATSASMVTIHAAFLCVVLECFIVTARPLRPQNMIGVSRHLEIARAAMVAAS